MPILKVKGVPPLDGDYDLDITSFTNRELHLIKQETGVRAGEIEEAFGAGDNDLLVAITLIVLQRAGKGDVAQLRDVVWDAEAGSVQFDLTDEEKKAAEDDARPPESEPATTGGASETTKPSGPSSANGGENPANAPRRIGEPISATGVTSA